MRSYLLGILVACAALQAAAACSSDSNDGKGGAGNSGTAGAAGTNSGATGGDVGGGTAGAEPGGEGGEPTSSGGEAGQGQAGDAGAGNGGEATGGTGGGATRVFAWDLPKGFPTPVVPPDNRMTYEKIELGRHLFYDKRLSGNGMQACASCHEQARAFTDGATTATGSTGQMHPRNSMSLTNVAYVSTFTWANPLVFNFEDQALVPMFGTQPVELGLNGMEAELLERLKAVPKYQELFTAAYRTEAEPFSVLNIVRALASFQRTLISGNSPFDRYQYGGDPNAISESAKRGFVMTTTERFECFHCHNGFNLQDSMRFVGKTIVETLFHNTALYNIDGNGAYPAPNRGVFEVTQDPADMGRFRAPTLRNVAVTAPYMHDGSIATLDGVLDHYAGAQPHVQGVPSGGRTIPPGSPNAGVGSASPLKSFFMVGFTLSEQERADFHAFFDSLTDEEFLTNPKFSNPWPP